MSRRTRIGAMAATLAASALLVGTLGQASTASPGRHKHHKPRTVPVQVLSFNDYHGQLEAPAGTSATLGAAEDPTNTVVGGGEYLATHLERLRKGVRHSTTVAAGDLIGGTPFLSGLFHDEPSVESLNAMDLDISSVGNHEFDEGVTELLRMQKGGCHPVDGCYTDQPYRGADYQWLAANVKYKEGTRKAGRTVLPPYEIKRYQGIKVAYIGMTLEGTPEIVAQAGIKDVEFLDEARTANTLVRQLKRKGVEAFVVLLHEGGFAPGGYDECGGLSDPIKTINDNLDPEVDLLVTGHTHSPYVCPLPDARGRTRYVTSASSQGRVVNETWLQLDRRTRDVVRSKVTSTNHLVTRDVTPDATQSAIIAKWNALSAPIANRVVGTIATDITRAADRQTESSLSNLIADAQLAATSAPADGGAVAAFMNPGGVRGDLTYAQISGGEAPGEVTYGEAFTVQPFGNLVVTLDLTGDAIERLLEQQFTADAVRLHLGVSEGFSYTYDLSRPAGDKVDPATITINGAPLDLGATYRITTNNFLADGGDGFSVLTEGTNRAGGGDDLAALIDYMGANPGLQPAPTDRVTELP
ncbi:bifunctional metallophosphatase/5'-nucleotidase [Nocardioides daphniae]|nr:bifunctional metallophosphatase/5'-nucleotidase [Nocardioides daphniae]GGD21935.1 5'-nucleotidase [Nocardioides daphniae]